ncbi:fumarylacetoacetate hydrolase family protein [Georgenia subflava]|uniref:5-carboxymethyl-2-hydroxymuconate isomerase n=1 Tax=Georgenia subflava TaxID=1622177 RepID=A0A6N7EEP3_9MICO|nr:fumarylacetoacetate hydrolase family protein [Georgenia subflava]MPV36902.1 5-carboxymethyl-2-hydroxymuconate isomerase [Georgenia subflava]
MRYGATRHGGERRTFLIEGEEALVLPAGAPTPDDIVREAAAREAAASAAGSSERLPIDELDLLVPLTRFNRDILCTGWNYWDHFEESKGKREGQDPVERPAHPTFFTKGPLSATGPHDPIAWDPQVSGKWDYEAEVAVVIGRGGRSIPPERAMDHVGAVLVANDVSQRDLQRAHGGQWLKGKSLDSTMPLGPWLTTPDEVDVADLRITLELNGRELQSASTRQMAFAVEQIIAELSWGMTLLPGDVILTGTPSGIGNAREPQVFMNGGDVLVTRVEGLGELRNTVTASSLSEYVVVG